MLFARSVHSSDAKQNSFGQGGPPKVSLKLTRLLYPHAVLFFCTLLLYQIPPQNLYSRMPESDGYYVV